MSQSSAQRASDAEVGVFAVVWILTLGPAGSGGGGGGGGGGSGGGFDKEGDGDSLSIPCSCIQFADSDEVVIIVVVGGGSVPNREGEHTKRQDEKNGGDKRDSPQEG